MGQVYGAGCPAQLAGGIIAPEWRWFGARVIWNMCPGRSGTALDIAEHGRGADMDDRDGAIAANFEAQRGIAALRIGRGEIFGGGVDIFVRGVAEAGEGRHHLFFGRADADALDQLHIGSLADRDAADLAASNDRIDAGVIGRRDGGARIRCLRPARRPAGVAGHGLTDLQRAEPFEGKDLRVGGGGGQRRGRRGGDRDHCGIIGGRQDHLGLGHVAVGGRRIDGRWRTGSEAEHERGGGEERVLHALPTGGAGVGS